VARTKRQAAALRDVRAALPDVRVALPSHDRAQQPKRTMGQAVRAALGVLPGVRAPAAWVRARAALRLAAWGPAALAQGATPPDVRAADPPECGRPGQSLKAGCRAAEAASQPLRVSLPVTPRSDEPAAATGAVVRSRAALGTLASAFSPAVLA